MATTSGRYTHGASGMGSSSNPTQEGFWSYAVPPQLESGRAADHNVSQSNEDSYAPDQRQASSQQPGISSRPRTRHSAKSRQASESGYPASGGLRPPYIEHQNTSGGSSEADSLLDLYKSNGGDRSRGTSRDRQRIKRKSSRGAVTTMDEPISEDAESKWIHRDKLMQIESRELAEMGGRMRPSRAGSRTKSVRTVKSSVDVNEDAQEGVPNVEQALRESKRMRQKSPSPKEEAAMFTNGEADPQLAFARSVSQREHERPPTRPGTSRIPVSSNVGSFGSESERLAGQHVRTGSMNTSDQQREAFKQRARSRSAASQNVLDVAPSPRTPELQESNSPSSTQNSPPKLRVVSKGTPGSDQRRPSTTRKVPSPRARSGSGAINGDSPRRPTTSGGSRPPTARPEGEAPWIATMYKPDPMIPPDQQMLPTHAKRLAQLQQEAEERAVQQAREDQQRSDYTLLDGEDTQAAPKQDQYAGVNGHGAPEATERSSVLQEGSRDSEYRQSHRSSTHGHQRELSEKLDGGQWPLRSPSPDEAQQQQYEQKSLEQSNWVNGKPSTNGSDGRNYGLMPTVQVPKDRSHRMSQRSGMSNLSSTQRDGNAPPALVDQPVRLREPSEEIVVKKKGCGGCCTVM